MTRPSGGRPAWVQVVRRPNVVAIRRARHRHRRPQRLRQVECDGRPALGDRRRLRVVRCEPGGPRMSFFPGAATEPQAASPKCGSSSTTATAGSISTLPKSRSSVAFTAKASPRFELTVESLACAMSRTCSATAVWGSGGFALMSQGLVDEMLRPAAARAAAGDRRGWRRPTASSPNGGVAPPPAPRSGTPRALPACCETSWRPD